MPALVVPWLLAAAAQTSPLDSVERYVAAEVTRQGIPGLSIAVLRGDRVVLARGFGYANVEHRVPATDRTIYQSGSIGKQFTAAALVMLADEGRVRLDDPVTRYLPEGRKVWDGITLRHLLTHTSGIPDYTDSTVDYRRAYSEDQLVRLAVSLPREFGPGERWSYSNTGYVLLGVVIGRVTGRFYGDFLRARIFGPAGMRTARIISESEIVPDRAAGYRLEDGKLRNQEWVSPELNTTADGSLYLSVADLAAWVVALRRDTVPGRSVRERSWTPVELRPGGTYPYGLGWSLTEQRSARRVGHTGSWQGFRTSFQLYPEHDLAVIVLANLAEAHAEAISYAAAGIVEPALAAPHLLAGPLGPVPPEPIPATLRRLGSGRAGGGITPGLGRFVSPSFLSDVTGEMDEQRAWTALGCDEVAGRRIARLGATVERICYARGGGAGGGILATVLYTRGWQVADVEFYDF